MAKASGKVSVQYVVVTVILILLIALVGGAKAAKIRNIDSTKLTQCLPAISG